MLSQVRNPAHVVPHYKRVPKRQFGAVADPAVDSYAIRPSQMQEDAYAWKESTT